MLSPLPRYSERYQGLLLSRESEISVSEQVGQANILLRCIWIKELPILTAAGFTASHSEWQRKGLDPVEDQKKPLATVTGRAVKDAVREIDHRADC